jgi:hypothetical protein
VSTTHKPTVDNATTPSKVQGEGDYESARRFDKDEQHFVETANVADLARKAAPRSKEEAAQLKHAEEIGRSHAHGGKETASGPHNSKESPRDAKR